MTSSGSRFVHRTLLAGSPEQTGDQVAGLLAGAHRQRRYPLVAVLAPQVEAAARSRLGSAATDVTFLPCAAGRAPGAVARDHLSSVEPRVERPTVVTAVLTDDDPYGSACLENEVLAERHYARCDAEHTCVYPSDAPFERIARVSHPLVHHDGVDHPNPDFRGDRLVRDEPALAHLDPDAVARDVVPHVDPDLRAWLADRARAAGMGSEAVAQFVLAAHEALRTGAESRLPDELRSAPTSGIGVTGPSTDALPRTRLYLHHTPSGRDGIPDGLVLDVDAARLPPLVPDRLPSSEVIAGLWFARKGCRHVDITVHPMTEHTSRIRVGPA